VSLSGHAGDDTARVLFLLRRLYGESSKLTFEFMVASLLSSKSEEELQAMNPYLATDSCHALQTAIATLLLTTSRLGQVNRCIASVDTLVDGIHALVKQRLLAAWELDAEVAAESGRDAVVAATQPTPEMIQRALDLSDYHAVRAKALLDDMCALATRLVGSPPPSLVSGAGRDDLRSLVMLALHLCDFDGAATLRALVDPTDVMALLSMASRGCYHKGAKLPNLASAVVGGSGSGSGGGGGGRTSHGSDSTSTAMIHVLEHTADDVAGNLVTRRYFMEAGVARADVTTGTTFAYDPRFLVFEYLIGFVLRRRQVELVNQFATAAKAGVSSVRQMIMGAGKTTVIAPILALMLADGNSLVFNVMPAALLEQSLGIMRNAFSSVIQKRVYTFHFDRLSKESSDLRSLTALVQKMDRARRERAVVCSTPEAVKSVMLKYVGVGRCCCCCVLPFVRDGRVCALCTNGGVFFAPHCASLSLVLPSLPSSRLLTSPPYTIHVSGCLSARGRHATNAGADVAANDGAMTRTSVSTRWPAASTP
jgi:hypothetical protein